MPNRSQSGQTGDQRSSTQNPIRGLINDAYDDFDPSTAKSDQNTSSSGSSGKEQKSKAASGSKLKKELGDAYEDFDPTGK